MQAEDLTLFDKNVGGQYLHYLKICGRKLFDKENVTFNQVGLSLFQKKI